MRFLYGLLSPSDYGWDYEWRTYERPVGGPMSDYLMEGATGFDFGIGEVNITKIALRFRLPASEARAIDFRNWPSMRFL